MTLNLNEPRDPLSPEAQPEVKDAAAAVEVAPHEHPRRSHITRLQRALFWSMLAGIFLMALFLFREHRRQQRRYSSLNDVSPLSAPYVDTENVTLETADDSTGAINAVQEDVALPKEPTIRARALLDRLFVEYALPKSAHPLPNSAAIDDIFLVKPPAAPVSDAAARYDETVNTLLGRDTGLMAIVSLRGAFVQAHPSGIAVEDMTLRSIIGTLHANNSDISQVRFLVDGQPRETLAGHADLTRTYPAIDTAGAPSEPSADNSSSSNDTQQDAQ